MENGWRLTSRKVLIKCHRATVHVAYSILGLWTTIRNDVLGNTNLAAVGFRAGLDACVHLNPGTNNVSNKTMATTIEAILGAVHRDGGDAALEKVMERLGLTHALLEAVTSNPPPAFEGSLRSNSPGLCLGPFIRAPRNLFATDLRPRCVKEY